MIDTTAVLGYAWPMAVAPGETIRFHLSSATLAQAQLRVVRVRCGDSDPAGPGIRTQAPGSVIDGPVALRHQPIHPGSCAIVPDSAALAGLREFSFGCHLFPTLVGGRRQTVAARWDEARNAGWKIELGEDGQLMLTVADGTRRWTVRGGLPLLEREWVTVAAAVNPAEGWIAIHQASMARDGGRDRSASAMAEGPRGVQWPDGVALVLAAQGTGRDRPATINHFNGKIDRPRLYAAALDAPRIAGLVEALSPVANDAALIAAWDFSRGIGTDVITDMSGHNHHGRLLHLPMRAATGANWDGRSVSWTEVPWQYGAIHFHDDDLADCGWSPDRELTVPSDWLSGFYALELTATTAAGVAVESYVPFFLRAPRDRATAPLAVVASTATFLAYANSCLRLDQSHFEAMNEGLVLLSGDDVYLCEHRELGLSTYDTHADGSGVCYSSGRRPILNMRPRGNSFNYVNDTHLLDWLDQQAIAYDIVTDEDIDREGARALQPYRTVITASHPEYFSAPMLDAFETYQNGGGRHMYLGGNGFYWRIAFHPTEPGRVEVRRGITGTRTWEGEAGENSLSFTGEPSGLWRSNGRPPQRLVGVGFDAQVFDHSAAYRRLPASFDPRVAFAFEGIGADEPIGDFGLRLGGAAGLEIDRADPSLGSAPNLLMLATADRIGRGGLPTTEEFRTTHRGLTGDQNARVRADIVFFETARGGAVFSTGSIAWVCALSHNGYDNTVSRLTGNVLRRFLDPRPFD